MDRLAPLWMRFQLGEKRDWWWPRCQRTLYLDDQLASCVTRSNPHLNCFGNKKLIYLLFFFWLLFDVFLCHPECGVMVFWSSSELIVIQGGTTNYWSELYFFSCSLSWEAWRSQRRKAVWKKAQTDGCVLVFGCSPAGFVVLVSFFGLTLFLQSFAWNDLRDEIWFDWQKKASIGKMSVKKCCGIGQNCHFFFAPEMKEKKAVMFRFHLYFLFQQRLDRFWYNFRVHVYFCISNIDWLINSN